MKEVLKKRLKNYYKRQKLVAANVKNGVKNTSYEYLVVIDFEATCEEVNDNFVHEIIEFPAVLINVEKQEIVSIFESHIDILNIIVSYVQCIVHHYTYPEYFYDVCTS